MQRQVVGTSRGLSSVDGQEQTRPTHLSSEELLEFLGHLNGSLNKRRGPSSELGGEAEPDEGEVRPSLQSLPPRRPGALARIRSARGSRGGVGVCGRRDGRPSDGVPERRERPAEGEARARRGDRDLHERQLPESRARARPDDAGGGGPAALGEVRAGCERPGQERFVGCAFHHLEMEIEEEEERLLRETLSGQKGALLR